MKDAQRHEMVEELFQVLLERGPEALDTAIDPALRRDAEELVAAYRCWSASLPQPSQSALPRFGPYQCDEMLGMGGMGAVYAAHRADGQFQQRVAIKVTRGSLRSEWFRRRFLLEREILARLNHPGISRLLDGGMTGEGEPYLVMEFVEGVAIDRHCDQKRLSISARLELFEQVLDAVDYAHRNLVIHRDLKPGNILVTAEGKAKLLDFGISKLTESDDPTTVVHALTPRYSSPEQLRGESVGVASDVYSAGVMLYELVSGAHPYGGATPVGGEFVQPAGLREDIQSDLANILAKAVAVPTGLRYVSIAAFRDDLQRFRAGLPILARQPTFQYRAAKFLARNRMATAAVVFIGLTIVGSAVYSQQQASAARNAARRAQAASDFIDRMFSAADVWQGGRSDIKIADVMDRASQLAYGQFAGEPAIESQVRFTLGNTFSSLELPQKAIAEFRRGLELARTAKDHRLTALHASRLARDLTTVGQLQESESLFRLALAEVPQLREADPVLEFDLVSRFGSFLSTERAAPPEAEAMFLRAIELAKSSAAITIEERATVIARLALFYTRSRREAEAMPLAQESLRLFRSMPSMSVAAYNALDVMAALTVSTGNQQEVVRLRREALDLNIRFLGYANPSTIVALGRWARSSTNLGKVNEVLPELERGVKELTKQYPVCVFSYWGPIETLSELLGKVGRFEEAEYWARAAMNCLPADTLGSAYESQTLFALGRALRGLGRYRESEEALRKSLAIYMKMRGPNHQTTVSVRQELDRLHQQRGSK
jgi:serine/threonine-protein kinase